MSARRVSQKRNELALNIPPLYGCATIVIQKIGIVIERKQLMNQQLEVIWQEIIFQDLLWIQELKNL